MTTQCRQCLHEFQMEDASPFGLCPSCGVGPEETGADSAWVSGLSDERLADELREALEPSGSSAESSGARYWLRGSFEPPIKDRIGEFEIIRELGRGAMGVVYRARQTSLDREVALKVLLGAGARKGSSVRRFRTEARAIARLNHPNVVPVFAHGEHEAHCFYAMALIEGCSLDFAIHEDPDLLSSTSAGLLASRTMSWSTPDVLDERGDDASDPSAVRELQGVPQRTIADFRHVARLFSEVADGLAHVHAHGVIHRDLKPQNLMLGRDGRIYITDFGLSLLADESHQTMTGEVLGTPAYLSPEQIRGVSEGIDHRTDIYSLGVTLYELLTNRRPFVGITREETITRICSLDPVPPRRIDRRIPPDLETICLRAMEKNANRRYAAAAAMADDLRRFADGMPILSRRTGMLRHAVRFAWRRRAAASIILAALATTVFGAAYKASRAASRAKEVQRLVQSAYEQLVYADYRAPEMVRDQPDRAEALDADLPRLNLVRAIASVGASDHADAIRRLQTVLIDEPEDVAALYLLSWAQWRANDRQNARKSFDDAERLGGPRNADEWFFRGLAAHFDRPVAATESYQEANAIRARESGFFPQAVLHLARSYNQAMYSSRTPEVFEDAQAILEQLIKRGHYRAYPHYLLSIAQRLYGEILEASDDPNEHALATNMFQSALDTARIGQTVDSTDDRPVTAEAECLERIGRFEEAVDARTRAIDVAKDSRKRCECLHYRWRLLYWLEDYENALRDVEAHAACMPESLQYRRVYPVWIYSELGDMETALRIAREIAEDAPLDPNAVLWSAACLNFLGHTSEADNLLWESSKHVPTLNGFGPLRPMNWVTSLLECAAGKTDLESLHALAQEVGEPKKLRAEADFHLGIRALGSGDRAEAVRLLSAAYRCFDAELDYTFHAKTLLTKLQIDPEWPNWITRGKRPS